MKRRYKQILIKEQKVLDNLKARKIQNKKKKRQLLLNQMLGKALKDSDQF